MYKKAPSGEFVPMKVRAASTNRKTWFCVTFEDIKTLDEAILYKGTVFLCGEDDDISRKKGEVSELSRICSVLMWPTRTPAKNTAC